MYHVHITEHNFNLQLKKKIFSKHVKILIMWNGGLWMGNGYISKPCYPAQNMQKSVKLMVILMKKKEQNSQI